MPDVTANLTTLRSHPHKIKLYLAVLKPASIYTALVDNADAAKGDRTITFDTGSGTLANVKAGMSLWVGTSAGLQDKGRVRIKSTTDDGGGTGTFVVAENGHIDWADDDHLTAKENYEYWPVYPRIADDGVFYKDYDIAYSDQNEKFYPVPIMGPPACAFLSGGTVNVYFDGQDSWCPGTTIAWGEGKSTWTFPSGNPDTSTAQTPGNVAWTTAGTYWVSLAAEDTANGKVTIGHRPVFIFDRSSNMPYTDFEVDNIRGSLRSGGWSFDVTVFGDADSSEFADGTMVVLFAEAWYDTAAKDFGMNHPGRHNIRCVGWIVDETVRKNPDSGDVTFSVQGLSGLMKSRQNFSVALDYKSDSPSKWYELKELDTERAIHHYLYWHSTVCEMTDVRVPSVFRAGFPSAYKIKFQDFARGSLWGALSRLCEEAFYVCGSDRASCLWIDFNLQCLESAYRAGVTNVMLLTHSDWEGSLEIHRKTEPSVSIVDFEGMAFDGTTVTPIISIAPGEAPAYMGSPKPSKRHILDPDGDWQAKANLLAGLKYAELNNEFPDITFRCMGDYSISDIVPREYFTLTLVAADTKRGIEWTAQNLIVQQMEERYNHEAGTCAVSFSFAKATLGTAGVTGDYPPAEPPTPPDNPPPTPIPPPTPGLGKWAEKVYVATTDLGVFYTANFVDDTSSPAGVPTWTAVSTGLDLDKECLGFRGDPFDPSGRQYCLMEDALYRRTGGNWSAVLTRDDLISSIGSYDYPTSKFGENGLETNINYDGWVAVIFCASWPSGYRHYFCYSEDYGENWTIVRVTETITTGYDLASLTVGAFQGDSTVDAGDMIYFQGQRGATQYCFVSDERGVESETSWNVHGPSYELGTSSYRAHMLVDPKNQDICYFGCLNGAGPWHIGRSKYAGSVWNNLDNSADAALGYSRPYYFISVTTGGIIRIGTAADRVFFYKTADGGVTWIKTAPAVDSSNLGLSLIQSAPDNLYILRDVSGNVGVGGNAHVIWASTNEGVTMIPKSGANADVIDTGDGNSIPYNCGGVRGILQIWEA